VRRTPPRAGGRVAIENTTCGGAGEALILALDVLRVVGDRLRSSSSPIPREQARADRSRTRYRPAWGASCPFLAGLTLAAPRLSYKRPSGEGGAISTRGPARSWSGTVGAVPSAATWPPPQLGRPHSGRRRAYRCASPGSPRGSSSPSRPALGVSVRADDEPSRASRPHEAVARSEDLSGTEQHPWPPELDGPRIRNRAEAASGVPDAIAARKWRRTGSARPSSSRSENESAGGYIRRPSIRRGVGGLHSW
jgi:hypothetical protein